MKTNKWFALGAMMWTLGAAGTLAPASAWAQNGSGVGGGKFSEEEIAIFYGRLKSYFSTDEWKGTFLEVISYNQAHQESFQDLMKSVTFKVVNHKVYAPNNDERDCVPMIDAGVRWIECNAEYLPDNNLDNQPVLYSFLLHELFVYAGIEQARGTFVPSTYEVSWRMADKANLSLVVQKVWVPGKGKAEDTGEYLNQSGITCISSVEREEKTVYAFIWQPNGDYALIRQHIPGAQTEFGLSQYQTLNRTQERIMNLRQSVAHFLGGNVITTVLARGNSMDLTREQTALGIGYKYRTITHFKPEVREDFQVNTISEIEKLPLFTRGSYTEFPLYVQLSKMAKKRDQYKRITMVCTGEADWRHFGLIPTQKIFQNRDQTVFSENYIQKYDEFKRKQ